MLPLAGVPPHGTSWMERLAKQKSRMADLQPEIVVLWQSALANTIGGACNAAPVAAVATAAAGDGGIIGMCAMRHPLYMEEASAKGRAHNPIRYTPKAR